MTGGNSALVVGAGALGCNAAWHLVRKGLQVTVVEAQDAPASQTTSSAAGFVTKWSVIHVPAFSKTEWEMQRYGIDFYTRLASESREDIGVHACGIAYIYLDEDAWRDIQPRAEQARSLGTQLEHLSAERAAEIVPWIDYERVAGILFNPDALRVRAADTIRALARAVEQDGVRFEFRAPVREFGREGDRIVGVMTERGDFHASETIVTAGAWSRALLARLGVDCPIDPRVTTRYVTEPLPGVSPDMPLLMFVSRDRFAGNRIYAREEQGGLLIGAGDPGETRPDRLVDANNLPLVDQIPADQGFRAREYMRDLEPVMPVLKQAEVASVRSGLPAYTSDRHFVAGRAPGWDGLSVIAGCQEAGITHGPALGRLIADLIVDGATEWDSTIFRLERFA